MLKRLAPFAGALTIAVGMFIGCSDSSPVAPSSTDAQNQVTDPYAIFKASVDDQLDFTEVPTATEALDGMSLSLMGDPGTGRDTNKRDTLHKPPVPPRDTLHKPPVPPRDTVKHDPPPPRDTVKHDPPRDTVKHDPPRDTARHEPPHPNPGRPPFSNLAPNSYERIIRQLHLTHEQDAQIRLCFQEYRECTRSAQARYNNAREALFSNLRSDIEAIKAAVASGELTRDEAHAKIEAITARYRHAAAELLAAYKAALASCEREFRACVAGHLTEEQLVIWNRLTH